MRVHTVKKGDTLWKIARQYGISFEELKRLNAHLANPDYIVPGMELFLPEPKKEVPKEHHTLPVKEMSRVKEVPHQPKELPVVPPKEQTVLPPKEHHVPRPKEQPKEHHVPKPKEQPKVMPPKPPMPVKEKEVPVPIPVPVPVPPPEPVPMPHPHPFEESRPVRARVEIIEQHEEQFIIQPKREVVEYKPSLPPVPPVMPYLPQPPLPPKYEGCKEEVYQPCYPIMPMPMPKPVPHFCSSCGCGGSHPMMPMSIQPIWHAPAPHWMGPMQPQWQMPESTRECESTTFDQHAVPMPPQNISGCSSCGGGQQVMPWPMPAPQWGPPMAQPMPQWQMPEKTQECESSSLDTPKHHDFHGHDYYGQFPQQMEQSGMPPNMAPQYDQQWQFDPYAMPQAMPYYPMPPHQWHGACNCPACLSAQGYSYHPYYAPQFPQAGYETY